MAIAAENRDIHYMQIAISLAKQSPPKPTNFRVGAVLVDAESDTLLATGYTLELPGNTHAEQCCFIKICSGHSEDSIGNLLPQQTVLYSTMEPCSKRLSGNLPCVDRILQTQQGQYGGIKTVYVGLYEPSNFVQENNGRSRLEAAGINFVHVPGFEDQIHEIATTGHVA